MRTAYNLIPYFINHLKIRNKIADHISDYNDVCKTYDQYYSKYLGKKADEMLAQMPLVPGGYYLDTPCGTGYLTIPIAQTVGANGHITAVDLSEGMLGQCEQCTRQNNLTNVSLVKQDMLEYLKNVPDESVDGIICSWGICYIMDHDEFISHASRVVKVGGTIGIIENTSGTLNDINKIYQTYILSNYPTILQKIVPKLNFPKNAQALAKKLSYYNFKVLRDQDGEVIIPCTTGAEIVDYMKYSGVSTGILDALTPDENLRNEAEAKLIRYLDSLHEKNGFPQIKHEFCYVVATKQ